MEDLVHNNNIEFASSLGPTLAYLVLLMLVGLVGNTLVFLVYYRRFKPSVTRTYILAMSVCDLLNNALALPSDIYEIRFHYDFNDDGGCKFFGYVTRFLALFGACILIAIAVDRRRKICQPSKKLRVPRDIYIELFFLGIFAMCLSSPFAVLRGIQTLPIKAANATGLTCSIDDVYVRSLFFVIYNASMGVLFVICVSIMAVSYALIARHLWRHKKRFIHNTKRRQNRTLGQDSGQTRQEIHKHADDFVDTAPAGKQPINITEDSEHITLHLDNTASSYSPQTSGVQSSSQTNVSDSETSHQRERGPSSNEVNIESSKPGDSSTVCEKGRRKFGKQREATPVTTPCDSHTHIFTKVYQPKSLKRKKSHSSPRGDPNPPKKIPGRTTLMMFVLTVMFIVSYLPYISMAAIYRGKDIVQGSFGVWNLQQIALRSFFINSAVNPLVYCFCSVRFRRECYLFLCRK